MYSITKCLCSFQCIDVILETYGYGNFACNTYETAQSGQGTRSCQLQYLDLEDLTNCASCGRSACACVRSCVLEIQVYAIHIYAFNQFPFFWDEF